MNTNIGNKKMKVTQDDVLVALQQYVKFHLKLGDLKAVPELRQFIKNNDKACKLDEIGRLSQ